MRGYARPTEGDESGSDLGVGRRRSGRIRPLVRQARWPRRATQLPQAGAGRWMSAHEFTPSGGVLVTTRSSTLAPSTHSNRPDVFGSSKI
jgi:hypothetical protein